MHSHKSSKPRLWAVLLLTSIYLVAEILGGIWSGSLALLADAGHMFIDAAAIGIGLFALWISQKPPTSEKTFGYYRAEILAALVNAGTLVAVSFWIFYEAWERLHHPSSVNGKWMTLVATGGLVVNLVSISIVHSERNHSLNVRGVWLHLLSDALGSASAIIAGILIWHFNFLWADPLMSFFIGVLILNGSWRLLKECVNVLLEGVPKGISIKEIQSAIEACPKVNGVHDLHVWMVTSGVNALSAHIDLEEGADHSDVLERVTNLLREKFKIDHATLQLEPLSYKHHELHF